MIRKAAPWIVMSLPGFVVTFVLDLGVVSGFLICCAIGAVAGAWAHFFDGGLPW